MTPAECKDTYRRFIDEVGEWVVIRRYTGVGTSKPKFDAQLRARVTDFRSEELVGGIIQGDRKVILLADDVIAGQITLPITPSDKIVVRGKELAIISPDDSTRRILGVLIAYELTARG